MIEPKRKGARSYPGTLLMVFERGLNDQMMVEEGLNGWLQEGQARQNTLTLRIQNK